jgi:hypothetical protein
MSTSVITRSGCPVWVAASPSLPSAASSTRCPWSLSSVTRNCRLAVTSSTIRMVAMLSLPVKIAFDDHLGAWIADTGRVVTATKPAPARAGRGVISTCLRRWRHRAGKSNRSARFSGIVSSRNGTGLFGFEHDGGQLRPLSRWSVVSQWLTGARFSAEWPVTKLARELEVVRLDGPLA